MKKSFLRELSLCLAIVMMICAFAGCSKKQTSSDNDSLPTEAVVSDNQSGGSSDKTDGTESVQENPEGEKNIYTENGIEFLVDPAKYKGTTVTYCTWRDPEKNEDGKAIKEFEKKYGIKVKVQMLNEGAYVSQIAASIASNTQGDVFFQNHTFPASLSVMQPLDAARINYNDPIWRQEIFNASTIDGHKYLVDAVSNVWTEIDICVYNKSLFEDNGITSPAEYYEAGNWTFETFEKACREIKALGDDYTGATIDAQCMLGAAGSSFFTYANNKLSVTADSKLYNVMQWLSKLKAEGLARPDGQTEFVNGKIGIAITDCFALKSTGYYSNMNPEDIAATYMPRYDKSSPQVGSHGIRGWGLIKGAKNPVAAGIFLREYLDVNNYDLDETFHNSDVSDFFFQVTNTEFDKRVYYHNAGVLRANGVINEGQIAGSIQQAWNSHSPDQIKAYLDSQLPVLNDWCKTANTIISDARKYLAENF